MWRSTTSQLWRRSVLQRAYTTTNGNGNSGRRLSSVLYGAGLVAAGVGAGMYWFPHLFSKPTETKEQLTDLIDSLQKPVLEKFLPAKQDDPKHPRPYTLVVDLDRFLVSHQFDKELGRWRVAKRPGAEIFLFYAAQLYEVVLFSSMQQYEGETIVRKLDPYGCISYSLFRFATRHDHGVYVKDLNVLNRDISKTIVIGHDTEGFQSAAENMLVVKPWNGDPEDRSLERAVDFLEGLALSRAKDVRPVIAKFKRDDAFFPDSYDAIQASAFEQAKQEEEERKKRLESNWFFRYFTPKSALPSLKSASTGSTPSDYESRKLERMATRQREWQHVKSIMQKQLEAEMAKEKQYYKEHKVSMWDFFSSPKAPLPSQSGQE